MIHDHESIDVFIGVDIGKSNHHAVALNRAGKNSQALALPQDDAKIRTTIRSLARHGRFLFVVDQPATTGAQAEGILAGYLPTCIRARRRRPRRLHHRQRRLPQTLRSVQLADDQIAEQALLCGLDDDLAKQATVTSNRIRGLHLRSIRPWNGSSACAWTTMPCPSRWPNSRPRPCCGRLARRGWKRSCTSMHRGLVNAGPLRSSLPWAS